MMCSYFPEKFSQFKDLVSFFFLPLNVLCLYLSQNRFNPVRQNALDPTHFFFFKANIFFHTCAGQFTP